MLSASGLKIMNEETFANEKKSDVYPLRSPVNFFFLELIWYLFLNITIRRKALVCLFKTTKKSLSLLFIGVLVGFIPFAIVSKCITWLFMEFIEIDM